MAQVAAWFLSPQYIRPPSAAQGLPIQRYSMAAKACRVTGRSGSYRPPPTQSTMPMPTDSPMTVVTVRLAPAVSLLPSCRPASTAAPAAKIFSMDTMMSSRGTVTPTAVRAMSSFSIPI